MIVGNNQQWKGTVPPEPAGTKVIWYIRGDGWDGSTRYYSNFGANFDYMTQ
jgi:hypothetical protein